MYGCMSTEIICLRDAYTFFLFMIGPSHIARHHTGQDINKDFLTLAQVPEEQQRRYHREQRQHSHRRHSRRRSGFPALSLAANPPPAIPWRALKSSFPVLCCLLLSAPLFESNPAISSQVSAALTGVTLSRDFTVLQGAIWFAIVMSIA